MEKDKSWVDVHNDALMVELGIRQPDLKPKDLSAWTKTPKEKRMLRKLRGGKTEHFHSIPIKFISYRDKLIIQLKKNKQYKKTTFSITCWQHEIPEILSKYHDVLLKYYWNGKTYKPTELPY